MYPLSYGKMRQLEFENLEQLIESVGYLANPIRGLKITREEYENKWGSESRLNFLDINNIPAPLGNVISAGNDAYVGRINNNDFVKTLLNSFSFVQGSNQNIEQIRSKIPSQYLVHFERGLSQ